MGEVKPKGCNGPHTSIMKDGENSMVNCPRCGELQLNFNKDGIVVDGYLDRIVELKAERDAFETEMERLLDEVINSNKFAKDHADKISSLESDLTRHKEILRDLAEQIKEAVAGREQWRTTQLENHDLKSKLEKAVEALEFYAKKESYSHSHTSEERGYPVRFFREELNDDSEVLEWTESYGAQVPVEIGGKKAREALNQISGDSDDTEA